MEGGKPNVRNPRWGRRIPRKAPLKRFKRKTARAGIMQEARKHEHYAKTERTSQEKAEAAKNANIEHNGCWKFPAAFCFYGVFAHRRMRRSLEEQCKGTLPMDRAEGIEKRGVLRLPCAGRENGLQCGEAFAPDGMAQQKRCVFCPREFENAQRHISPRLRKTACRGQRCGRQKCRSALGHGGSA